MGRFISQPTVPVVVDRSHPLGKRLVFAYLPNSQFGYDAVTGQRGSVTITNSYPVTNHTTEYKQTLRNNRGAATNRGRVTFTGNYNLKQGMSVFTLQRRAATGGASSAYWSTPLCLHDGKTNIDLQWIVGSNAVDTAQDLRLYESVGSVTSKTSAGTAPNWTDTSWWSAGFSMAFGGASTPDYYLRGAFVTFDSGQVSFVEGTDDRITTIEVGCSSSWPDESFDGDIAVALVFDSVLTAEEHAALDKNPWELFKPKYRQFALADPLPQTRSLTVPQVWTKQPPVGTPIDWSHPLATGLAIFAYPVGLGRFYDAVYKDLYTTNDRAASTGVPVEVFHPRLGRLAKWSVTPSGVGLQGPTSDFDPKNRFTSNDVSMASRYRVAGDTSGNRILLGMHGPSVGANEIFIRNTKWNAHTVFATNYSSSSYDTAQIGTYVNGEVCYCGDTHINGAGNTSKHSKLEYRLAGGASATYSWSTYGVDQGTLDYTYWNANFDRIAWGQDDEIEVEFAAFWNRPLTEEEHLSMAENPWQIFKAPEMHVPIEYQELTFDSDSEERLFWIPQTQRKQP